MHVHPRNFELPLEIFQHLVKLFFARNARGHVELATDFVRGFKQMHLVPTLAKHACCCNACCACANDSEFTTFWRRRVDQFCLVASAWIDQARRHFPRKYVIEAGLIAADAYVDFVATTFRSFLHEFRVGEEGPRH